MWRAFPAHFCKRAHSLGTLAPCGRRVGVVTLGLLLMVSFGMRRAQSASVTEAQAAPASPLTAACLSQDGEVDVTRSPVCGEQL